MKKIYQLFRLQIDEYYDFFKTKDRRKLVVSLLKYLAIIILITGLLLYFSLSAILLNIKFNVHMYALIITITQVIALIFGFGHVISALFLNHNNEIMLSMPISSEQLFTSKMIFIYVKEVITNAIFLIPIMIIFNILMAAKWYIYILLIPYVLILPLFPLAIISLLIIPITKLYLLLKKIPLLNYIVSAGLILGLLIFYVLMLERLVAGFDLSHNLGPSITKINLGILNFSNSVKFYQWLALGMSNINYSYYVLLFLVISALLLVSAYFIIKPFYIKTSMKSKEFTTTSYKKKPFVKRSNFLSLLHKEFATMFRSPGYLFENHLFTFLMPVVVILYNKLLKTLVVNQLGSLMINGAHLLVILILTILSNISHSNVISKEKEAFNLMKIFPINYYKQSFAKILPNLILTISSIIITGGVSLIFIDFKVSLLTTIIAILLAIGHALSSFDRDLRTPVFLKNHQVNQGVNKNIMLNTIYGLLFAIMLSVLVLVSMSNTFNVVPWIIIIVILIIYIILRLYRVILRINYRYNELYN